MAIRKLKTKSELVDFSSVVLLCSPDRYPYRDWLPDDEQMNLDRAFDKFRLGVCEVYKRENHAELRERMLQLLGESYAAYKAGDTSLGARKIREFRVEAGVLKSAD